MELSFIEKHFNDEILEAIGVFTDIPTISKAFVESNLAPIDIKMTTTNKEEPFYTKRNTILHWLQPSTDIYTYIIQYRVKEFWRHAKRTKPLEIKINKVKKAKDISELGKLIKQIARQKDELLLLNRDIELIKNIELSLDIASLQAGQKNLKSILQSKLILAQSVSQIIQDLQDPTRLTKKKENQETSEKNALWYRDFFTVSRSSKPLHYSLALAYHYTRCVSMSNFQEVSEAIVLIIEKEGGGKVSVKNALGKGINLVKEISKTTNGSIIDITTWAFQDRRQKAILREDGKRAYKISHKIKKRKASKDQI